MKIIDDRAMHRAIGQLRALNAQTLANCVQLTGDQIIDGTKTFNAPIRGMLGGSEETTVLSKIKRQGVKNIRHVAIQDMDQGFLNYIHWEWAQQYGDDGTPTIAFWFGLRANKNQTYWGCVGDLLQFLNPSKIRNLAAPTDNSDAANKAYVDAKLQGGVLAKVLTNVPTTADLPEGYIGIRIIT